MENIQTKEIEKKCGSIPTSMELDPDAFQIRVAAHSFAKEFWNEVIDVTEGDADALMGVYATLAVLVERERLYHLTFHFLYAFHLWMGAETTLPVDQLEKKPALTEDFLQVFILFSQVILEGFAEDIMEDDDINIFDPSFSERLMQETESDSDEPCVLCGAKTGYKRSHPIQQRSHYIEGAGQLCPRCYHETYQKE